MTDRDALLTAIEANPHEDTPHLMYADWCDEFGRPDEACDHRLYPVRRRVCATPGDDAPRLEFADICERYGRVERAEFVRVQCRLAEKAIAGDPEEIDPHEGHTCYADPCPICTSIGEFVELQRREEELLDNHGYGWCDGLLGSDWKTYGLRKEDREVAVYYGRRGSTERTDEVAFGFSRGFVSALTCTAADFLRHERELLWHPEHSRDVCPGCGGHRVKFRAGPPTNRKVYCRQCSGAGGKSTGSVPRPMPATAQPVERVTLTTRVSAVRVNGSVYRLYTRDDAERVERELSVPCPGPWGRRVPTVAELLAAEWPWLRIDVRAAGSEPDAPDEAVAGTLRHAYEAGVRAAAERNRQVMDAFLNAPPRRRRPRR